MAGLLDSFVAFDAALRAWGQVVGQSRAARRLAQATAALRRDLARAALADQASAPDPQADFATLVEIAAQAGVDWHAMRDAINTAHSRHPGR